MREAVRTERDRGDQLSADVLSNCQEHVKSYIDQHKQVIILDFTPPKIHVIVTLSLCRHTFSNLVIRIGC